MASNSASTVSEKAELAAESRIGRSKQRYSDSGERLVAGVVPVTEDREFVLLIQSSRRNGWVLPKGGWESDEEVTEAATREAWEEAGIEVRIDYDLGTISDKRKSKHLSPARTHSRDKDKDKDGKAKPRDGKSVFHFFEATVTQEHDKWPESHKRERRWMTYSQALEELKNRAELLEALERCSLKRL